jgi:hypothetical protein
MQGRVLSPRRRGFSRHVLVYRACHKVAIYSLHFRKVSESRFDFTIERELSVSHRHWIIPRDALEDGAVGTAHERFGGFWPSF